MPWSTIRNCGNSKPWNSKHIGRASKQSEGVQIHERGTMKPEPFGWFAPRAPKIAEPAKVATGLEFLVKADADDSSALEPEPTAEVYCENDGSSLKKLFKLEMPESERRSDTSMAYEDLTKAVFGSSDPTVMDIRGSEPIAAPKP